MVDVVPIAAGCRSSTPSYLGCTFALPADTARVSYYTQVHDYVKGISKSQQLIFNPGQPVMPEAYMNLSDVFVSFEGSAQSYSTFTPAAYTNNYASSKFWHVVYGCDTDATINSTLQQFNQQHAAWLYMTDLLEPNPYENLAGNATWTAELNYMAKHTTVGYAFLASLALSQSIAAWLATNCLFHGLSVQDAASL